MNQRPGRRRPLRGVTLIIAFATAFAVANPAQAKPGPHTTITSAPPSMTTSTTATLAFTSSISGSTFTCSLDSAPSTACTSPKTYTGLAQGSHTFAVAATANGVTETSPATATWTVDTTAPAAPANLTGSASSTTSVALAWTAGTDRNGVTSNQILRDGTLLTTVGAVTSYTDSKVTAGSSHSYAVVAVDPAGNMSAASNTVTVTTPAAPTAPDTVIDSGPSGTVTSTTATFTFHATLAGATFSCSLDGAKAASCTSPRTYNGLAQGAHTFAVTATVSGIPDPTAATATWSVDSIAPTVPAGLTTQNTGDGSVRLTWNASTDAGGVAGYDVFRGGVLLASVVGTVTSYTDGTTALGSIYKYAVRATDAADNQSALSTPSFIKVRVAYDPHLTRAPYLTDLVGRHVAINFATDQSSGSASVQYGAVDGSGNCTPGTTVTATRTTIQVGTVAEYQWTAEVDLPAVGTYCYRVYLGGTDLLAGNSSPRFTTQVPFGSTSGFTFDVLGDWGQVDANGQNADQANLMTQIAASGARFLVTVGDNGYPNGSQINYGDLQQTGADTSAIFGPSMWSVPGASIPIFTAPGNHGLSGVAHTDITTWTQASAVATSGGRYQNDVYCCVNGSNPANYGSEWYAFDVGNTRIYILDAAWGDTNGGTATPYANDALAHFAPGTPEYQWLANDLRTHTPQLKLAFFHYPLYSDNNTQPSDTYLDGPANLEGLLAANGVQMVFNGHAHIYERNNSSASGMPISYVTGGGGATLEPMGTCSSIDAYAIGWSPTNQTGSTCGSARTPASAANVYHFLKVTVTGTSVTVTPTDSLGNTFDVRTYTFKVPPDTYFDTTPPAGTTGTSATFAFHASGSPATFTCKLDSRTASSCTSPVTYTDLAEGQHTFTVAATVNKQTDQTPATYPWVVDHTAPSAPSNLTASAASPFEVDLTWTAAGDNTGVTGYRIFRDGSFYKAVGAATSFADPVLGSSTHSYAVSAVDAAGNESGQSTTVQITTPAPPVPIFQDGFESGDLSAWDSSAGLVVESADARTGQNAAEGNTTNGATFAKKTLPAAYSDGYARLAFRVLSLTDQINLLRIRDDAGNSVGYVYLSNTGFLGFHNDALGTNTLSDVAPGSGWHVVELRIALDSSPGTATGAVQVWFDNQAVAALSDTATDVGATQIGSIQIGEVQTGRVYDVLFDDAAFGTSRLGPVADGSRPAVPTGLAATANSGFEVDLSWDAPADDTVGYRVFRDGTLLDSVGQVTSYVDATVVAGQTYSYTISAFDAAGNASDQTVQVQITTPPAQPPVFADGFESGGTGSWSTSSGLAVEGVEVRSGTYAAEANTSAGATWAKQTLPGSYTDAYARVAFAVNSLGAQMTLLRLRDAPTGVGGYVYLTAGGKLGFRSDALATGTTSSLAPGPGWHVLELHLVIAGGSSSVQVWLDGAAVPDLTFPVIDLGSSPIKVMQIGDTVTTGAWDVFFDDAAFGTSRLGTAADAAPPAVPTGLAASASSGFEVDLSWDAPADDTVGYRVFRDGTLLGSVGQVTSYADASVVAGRTYSYSISAFDAAGNSSGQTAGVQITTPAAAPPVFADGFESGDTGAWSTSSGLAVQAVDVRSGTYAAEADSTGGATWAKQTLPGSYTDAYARVAFAVNGLGTQATLLRLRDAPTGVGGYVYLTAGGKLGFRSDALTAGTTSSVAPGPGWHVVELQLLIAGATSSVQVWLDGAVVPDLTFPVIDLGSSPIKVMQIGDTLTSGSWDIVFDDAAFGTSRLGPVADNTPPTTPENLTATAASPFSVALTWDPSTDDSGVAGYDVYRDGSLIAKNVAGTQYTDAQVLAGTSHSYQVLARDVWNNLSALSSSVELTTPPAAPPVFADGFESGNLGAWSSTAGLVVQSSDVHTGSYAAEGNTTTGATYAKKTLTASYDDGYARVAFDVKSQVSQINLLRLRDTTATSLGYLYLDTSGHLALHLDGPNTNTVSTAVPTSGWHVVELQMTISTGVVDVWLDGVRVTALSKSGSALGTTPIGALQIGETTTARTYDVVFDDAAFSDSRIGTS